MPFQIIRNDISQVKADVIVNTSNPKPAIGGGTDSAIYRAAGEEKLLEARTAIGEIKPGEAYATDAFDLGAKYVIHTVGPVWNGGGSGEKDILYSCYENSLRLALKLKCESIAFPLISSGTYGFPKNVALDIALSAIGKFLLSKDMSVILVVFDRKSVALSAELMGQIEQFIDDHQASIIRDGEYSNDRSSRFLTERIRRVSNMPVQRAGNAFIPLSDNLGEVVRSAGKGFRERLFELIDESGMDDVEVYKKANIDRKVFSCIKRKENYKPKKKTAVAFAVALELDMPTMLDLLARAEIAFSPGNTFDLIIAYFVTHRNYDMFEINSALFRYDQPLLGE